MGSRANSWGWGRIRLNDLSPHVHLDQWVPSFPALSLFILALASLQFHWKEEVADVVNSKVTPESNYRHVIHALSQAGDTTQKEGLFIVDMNKILSE